MRPFCAAIFLLLATSWSSVSYAQTTDASAQIVLRPTIPAYYPGCTNEPEGSEAKATCSGTRLLSYIANNLQYPDEARENKIEGVVVLSFVVTCDGNIEQVRILRDIGAGCGAATVAIIEDMPKWQPAIHKGKTVNTQFTLPVTFGLKTGMFDYTLHLGNLSEGEVSQRELLETVSTISPSVTDPKGDSLLVAEMVYTFERGSERRQLVTRGTESPDRKDFSKFIGRKSGRLTIEANAVEALDIKTVSMVLLVLR